MVRCHSLLSRLFPYVNFEKTAVCGRLAIIYWCDAFGVAYPQRPISGVDLVSIDIQSINPRITSEMWVYQEKRRYLAIRHRATRMNVNVFTDGKAALDNSVIVNYGGHPVRIVSLEQQVAKLVHDVNRVHYGFVDPKQFADLELLLPHCDVHRLQKAWNLLYRRQCKDRGWQVVLEEAIAHSKKYPMVLVEDPFKSKRTLGQKVSIVLNMAFTTLSRRLLQFLPIKDW